MRNRIIFGSAKRGMELSVGPVYPAPYACWPRACCAALVSPRKIQGQLPSPCCAVLAAGLGND